MMEDPAVKMEIEVKPTMDLMDLPPTDEIRNDYNEFQGETYCYGTVI